MMKKRYKRIDSGRLVQEILYTGINPTDSPRVRAEKTKLSSKARQKINDKCSWMALKRVLALNFSSTDLFITLTFSDKFLPRNRKEARALLKQFWMLLRLEWRRRGIDLKYVYAIEGCRPGDRPHIHAVINGSKISYKAIRDLWKYGLNLRFERVGERGYEDLARYLSKEAREYGRAKVGERSWVCSRNIERPTVNPTRWVPESFELEVPPGAIVERSESIENQYGRYTYLEYILPRRRKKSPGMINTKTKDRPPQFSNLEQCIINESGRGKACN